MLIVGLLVGGLILICLIAFAYAKFSQTKDEEVDQEQIKNGLRGANARRAQGTGQKLLVKIWKKPKELARNFCVKRFTNYQKKNSQIFC
jgi:hypothetical protein